MVLSRLNHIMEQQPGPRLRGCLNKAEFDGSLPLETHSETTTVTRAEGLSQQGCEEWRRRGSSMILGPTVTGERRLSGGLCTGLVGWAMIWFWRCWAANSKNGACDSLLVCCGGAGLPTRGSLGGLLVYSGGAGLPTRGSLGVRSTIMHPGCTVLII